MQIPSVVKKFGRDVVYLRVIGGLVGWIWMDGKRAEVCKEVIAMDLRISRMVVKVSTPELRSGEYVSENAEIISRNRVPGYTAKSLTISQSQVPEQSSGVHR